MKEGTAAAMDAFKINVKLFCTTCTAGSDELVRAFHGLIQRQAVPGHLLVDVADYAHVHNGPGTVLVAHEANLTLDRRNGQAGLTYGRKQPASGTLAERVGQAIDAARRVAAELEQDPSLAGKVRFDPTRVEVRFNDRLRTPNTPEILAAVTPAVTEAIRQRLGASATLVATGSPAELLTLDARATP